MSLKKFKHVILTKFNTQPIDGKLVYDKPFAENWMDYRMGLFERTKESVLSQDAAFTWVIALDPRTHDKYYRSIATDERITITPNDIRAYFDDHKVEEPWVITTRIDNDDFYLPGALKAIQSKFEEKIKVIDIGFYKMHNHTHELFLGERYNSMFISLVEPRSRVATVFCRPHGQLAGGYPMEGTWDIGYDRFTKIPYDIVGRRWEDRYVVMVCHEKNAANQILSSDKYCCELKDL